MFISRMRINKRITTSYKYSSSIEYFSTDELENVGMQLL